MQLLQIRQIIHKNTLQVILRGFGSLRYVYTFSTRSDIYATNSAGFYEYMNLIAGNLIFLLKALGQPILYAALR